MINYKKISFPLILLIVGNLSAQLTQSSNISLNKVFINPAFAGEKGKNRISIQNSLSSYDFDSRYSSQSPDYKFEKIFTRNYKNLYNGITYDSYSKKTGLGYMLSYTVTGAGESNENWITDNSSYSGVNNSFTTGHINQLYLVSTFGGGLNYKIRLKEKEDNNAGTLSVGVALFANKVRIERDEWGQNIGEVVNNYDSTQNIEQNYSFSQEGDTKFTQLHKLNVGMAYNIKRSYIATNIEYTKIGFSTNAITVGLMAGTVISKKVEQPKFSFVPQIMFRASAETLNQKDYNLTQQKVNYTETPQEIKKDTTTENGFYNNGYNQTSLNKENSIFQGINAAVNLDFHYQKLVLGFNINSNGNGVNIGINHTNFKIMLCYSKMYSSHGTIAGQGKNINSSKNISLSTNILF